MSTRPRRPTTGVFAAVALTATVAAAVAACGGAGSATRQPGSGSGPVTVVTSTDVWASVVKAVGGDQVNVSAILGGMAGDPHSHQVSAKDAARLRGAELVVYNGGGYDDFVEQSLGPAGSGGPQRIVAFDLRRGGGTSGGGSSAGSGGSSGGGASGGAANEHVWYDLPTVANVTGEIASQLSLLRPAAKAGFIANADAFDARLDSLEGRVGAIASAHHGRRVIATEPVAHYLLDAAKLDDVTPHDFVDAVEEETDPPAAAVAEIQRVVTQRQVDVLVHNPQTETPVVTDLIARARAAGLPVVDLTETLPTGQDYLTWMDNEIRTLSEALSRP